MCQKSQLFFTFPIKSFKKLLYKTLVKYYISNKVKAPFEDFALGLQIVRASLAYVL